MVFVSLEGVVRGSFTAPPAAGPAPIRVVVTPGSAAKCSASSDGAQAPPGSATRLRRFWRGDSASHFVCFVTDNVVRHKWVVVKRSSECAALRKLLLRATGDCRGASGKKRAALCSCRAVRAMAKASASTSSGANHKALEELLNALLGAMLTNQANDACPAASSALAVVESFLDVEPRRADAVARLVRKASSADDWAVAASQKDEDEDESPEQPNTLSSECSICCGALASGETLRLPCGHEFHGDCVRLWLRMQQTCPECRVAARTAA